MKKNIDKSKKQREDHWDKEIEIERNANTSDDDKIARAKKLPSWKATDEEKKLLAISMIPDGARRLYEEDFAEFRGSLIAGWSCDSKGVYYGICESSSRQMNALHIPNYSLCVTWEPTIYEVLKYIGKTRLSKDYARLAISEAEKLLENLNADLRIVMDS